MEGLIKEDPNRYIGTIRKIQAFSILPYGELRNVISQMRSFHFKAGTTIVHQREAANMFFIVHRGMVEVSVKPYFFKIKHITILKPGDFFGESALVSNSRRNATVKALTDTTCFVLLKPSFKNVIQESPLFREIMKTVSSRRRRQLKNA